MATSAQYKQDMLQAAKHNPSKQPLPVTQREALYPSNKLIYFKDSVYDGLAMTSGILLATFLIRQIKKDMAPQLTSKNAVSLAIVTILSDYLIDYGKRYEYIPYKIM